MEEKNLIMENRNLKRRLNKQNLQAKRPIQNNESSSDDDFNDLIKGKDDKQFSPKGRVQNQFDLPDFEFNEGLDQMDADDDDHYYSNARYKQIAFDPDIDEPDLLNVDQVEDSDEEEMAVSFLVISHFF